MLAKRPVKFNSTFVDILFSTIGSTCFLVILNMHYFRGQEKFLGAHDTEIPFFASWQFTRDFTNGHFSIFNFSDQTDFGYAHGTTGHFTISSALVAIISLFIKTFFDETFNGQHFLQLHTWTWVACQLLIRNIGFVPLFRLLRISRLTTILTLTLVQPILTFILTLYYLIGLVYSFIPILLYLAIVMIRKKTIKSAFLFLAVLSIAIGQAPLFAIAYMFQPIYIFILTSVFLTIYAKRKERQSFKASLLFIVSNIRFSHLAKNIIKASKIDIFQYSFLIVIIISNLAWSSYSLFSIKTNYSILEDREFVLSKKKWIDLTLGNGANDLTQLIDSTINATNAGWQYTGLAILYLFFLGVKRNVSIRTVKAITITILLLVVMQISPLYALSSFQSEILRNLISAPLKLFALFFKTIYFPLFPFSPWFRSANMLVWAVYLLSIPLVALGIDSLIKRKRELNGKFAISVFFFFILADAAILIFSHEKLSNQGKVSSLTLLMSFVILCLFVSREYSRKVIIFATIATCIFASLGLKQSTGIPLLFGGKIEGRSFKLSASQPEKSYSIVEYVSPFTRLKLPKFLYAIPPVSKPKTGLPLLDMDSDNSRYFNRQTNVSNYWGLVFLEDYEYEENYQSKHVLFRNLRISSENRDRKLKFANYATIEELQSKEDLFSFFVETHTEKVETNLAISGATESREAVNVNGQRLAYLVIRSDSLKNIEANDLAGGPIIRQLKCSERYFKLTESVFGLPITIGSYSINSFESNAIHVRIEDVMEELEDCQLNIAFAESRYPKSMFLKRSLVTYVTRNSANSLVWAIPFQTGWVINRESRGSVVPESCQGWLCVKDQGFGDLRSEGKFILSFEPVSKFFSTTYFFQGLINIVFLVILRTFRCRNL